MNTAEFKYMFGWVLFCIIVLGTCGNAVSFIIWIKGRRCRTYAGSVYLIALAISDTSVLCLSGSYFAVDFAFGVNLSDLNEFMCKLFRTSWHFTLLVSTYIVVCLTVERVLAVRWPLQACRWTSRRKTMMILFLLVCVCFAPNLPWTIGSTLLPVQERDTQVMNSSALGLNGMRYDEYDTVNNKISTESEEGADRIQIESKLTCQDKPSSFIHNYETIWHKWFIDFCMLYTVPLTIITTCNVIILVTICKQNRQIMSRDSRRHSGAGESASRAMTARVIAISVVHCMAVGPYSIAVLIPDFIQKVERIESISFLYIIFTCIWYINHSVNFILYSLFGSAFRQDCYDFFCRRCSDRVHRGTSSNMSVQAGSSDVTGAELTTISAICDH